MKSLLLNYTNYNVWANDRIITFLKDNVSDEQLDKEIVSSFPSLRKTLFHIWDAEGIWLARLNGNSSSLGSSHGFNGNTEDGYSAILSNSKKFVALVEAKEETYFQQLLLYANIKGDKFENIIHDAIQHCMNHSTFHRGQIIMMLRQLGFTKLFATDYIAFRRQ